MKSADALRCGPARAALGGKGGVQTGQIPALTAGFYMAGPLTPIPGSAYDAGLNFMRPGARSTLAMSSPWECTPSLR